MAKSNSYFKLPEGKLGYSTWWLIPLSKWAITPVISGLTLLIPCQSLGL